MRDLQIKIKIFLSKAVHRWLLIEKDPAKITRSFAFGILIGLTIPIGFQSIVSVPISLLFNCNVVIMITATFISNPLTVIPIYYSAMLIGEKITGIEVAWNGLLENIESFSIEEWLSVGGETLFVLTTGVIIQGVIGFIVTYFIFKYSIETFYRRKNQGN